jgi:hypothetical protein
VSDYWLLKKNPVPEDSKFISHSENNENYAVILVFDVKVKDFKHDEQFL